MENILNKVIEIEDNEGNTILALMIDDKGSIKEIEGGTIADEDVDYIFNTEKNLIRIQQELEVL